ncbi:BREX system ATP-binding domain-containing protein [Nitrospira sp. M1]
MSKLIDALNRLQSLRSEDDVTGLDSLQNPTENFQEALVSVESSEIVPELQPVLKEPVQQDNLQAAVSMEINQKAWLEIVRREYLQGYVRDGGGAVKFVVLPDADSHKSFSDELGNNAHEEQFVFAKVDARYTKAHMVDRLFHKVAKQLDWDELAYEYVVRLLADHGYQVPAQRKEFTLHHVATLNERKEPLLRRDLQTWLEETIEGDANLCREFRMAIIRLCLAQLESGESDRVLGNAVKEWLCGELRLISGVKKALIFQKIVRHNARYLLSSLTHWLRLAGKRGLIMTVDISRYLVAKRPAEPDRTLHYSPTAVLDLYDMLRQFIDTSDELEGFMMVVQASPEFLTDAKRGIDRYEALKHRIWDDVRDKHRQNPLVPLVRLSPTSSSLESLRIGDTVTSETDNETLMARRVIEGLRAGVPNSHVVKTLGCSQGEIEWRFRRLLEGTQQNIATGQCSKGLIVEGSFGSGKSHVLEYLQHVALESNFICSRVVISKETPLYHPVRMFHAAVESAVIPDKKGELLSEVASQCDSWDPKYKSFRTWVNSVEAGIDPRFAATLFLYERMGTDQELGHRMTRFWTGDPLGVGELKKHLKECGIAGRYSFGKISQAELASQRFQFTSRLIQSAGYAGWIVLVDEVEVMGRYSVNQRAKSYAELARLVGGQDTESYPGIGVVVALTDDFQKEVLEGKGDMVKIPQRLRAVSSDDNVRLAEQAEIGMNLVESRRIPIEAPTEPLIQQTHQTVRSLHVQAHNWRDWDHSAVVPHIEVLPGTRMREYVKSWITELDLKRLTPDEVVEIEVDNLKSHYEEDRVLATVSQEDSAHSKVEAPGKASDGSESL